MDAAQRTGPAPQFDKVFVTINADGTWGGRYTYVQTLRPGPGGAEFTGLGEFIDKHGGLCEIPFDKLHRVGVAKDKPDPVQAQEDRLYRTRSRKSTPQRRSKRKTLDQLKKIFALGKQRGLDIDDLRSMTPQRSISKLTMQEAITLIDRLEGRHRG